MCMNQALQKSCVVCRVSCVVCRVSCVLQCTIKMWMGVVGWVAGQNKAASGGRGGGGAGDGGGDGAASVVALVKDEKVKMFALFL